MLEINLNQTIEAPSHIVWHVLLDTPRYAQWNPFITRCHSSFLVGDKIAMRVNLLPRLSLWQKETIRTNLPEQHLSYGIKLPFGMLKSHRQHILASSDNNQYCNYQSLFLLEGWLSPLVAWLLAKPLKKGFSSMAQGLAKQSHMLAKQADKK